MISDVSTTDRREKITITLMLSAVLWLVPGIVRAQEIRAMAFSEAIGIALDRNLDLKQVGNQVALGETAVQEAKADFYPDLSLRLTPSQRYGQAFDQTTGRYENQVSETLNLTAASSINLFDGFGNTTAYRAAGLDLKANRESLEQMRQRIVYETASGFLQVNMDEGLIRIEEENLNAQQQQLRRIEAFWKQGKRAKADVQQQQASVALAELRLLTVQRSAEVSRLHLKQTLNLDPVEAIRFVAMASDLAEDASFRPEPLIGETLLERSDVEAQQHRIEAAEERIQAAKAGYLPTLSFSLSAGTNYSSLDGISGMSDQLFNHNPTAGVALSLNLPIFDQSRTRSNVARAQVQFKNEQLSLESLLQTAAFEAQQATLDFQTARKQVGAAQAQEQAAQEALAATEERYTVGAATLVELSQSRATYVDAASSLMEARYGVLMEHLTVEYSRGNIEQAVAALSVR